MNIWKLEGIKNIQSHEIVDIYIAFQDALHAK